MAKYFPDGDKLPYLVAYSARGQGVQPQVLRFSSEALADQEVLKLLRRGHSVDLLHFDSARGQYVMKNRYNS